MAGDRSFAAYIRDRFYNDCYSALEGYVEDNKDSLAIVNSKLIHLISKSDPPMIF
jgi:hypothetical protein